MSISPDKFLLPEEDGLPTRASNLYALYKLKALSLYIEITNAAMRNKPWADRYYIDLQAGPGKNTIGNSILLGSPLIALTTEYPFTQYRFNELKPEIKSALETRVRASNIHERVKIFQDDANEIVRSICDEIKLRDKTKDRNLYSTLNLAFLDPEGLELHWSTVEHLASVNKMDLIINFSTSGLRREIGAQHYDIVDRFFGSTKWRKAIEITDATKKRRYLIDTYLSQLKQFGYNVEVDPDLGSHDIAFKNSRNAQVYSLIFASKNPLGDKFWREAAKRTKPPKLPGF